MPAQAKHLNNPDPNKYKDRVIVLLDEGLMTQGEAAELIGVTRQRIYQWVRKARIHPLPARARRLRALLTNAHP